MTYKHLDGANAAVFIVYVDFSSAFNTISPVVLAKQLISMKVNPYKILWICSFLTNRSQSVLFNSVKSSNIVTNTGAPQGCVLSPVLFTLHTSGCRATHDRCKLVKYADDTAIVCLINKREDNLFFNEEVNTFVQWCDNNHLLLNVKKTKEMVIDFGRTVTPFEDLVIKGNTVDRVSEYKYLGTIIDNQLNWQSNTERICTKTRKRLHYLRKLKEFEIDNTLLRLFYDSVIGSVLSFGIVGWFGNLTGTLLQRLERIEKTAGKIIRDNTVHSLNQTHTTRTLSLSRRIVQNKNHPLCENFKLLRSGLRLMSTKTRTNRFKDSFIPMSVRLLNGLDSSERAVFINAMVQKNN
jgi:hypothetical protein